MPRPAIISVFLFLLVLSGCGSSLKRQAYADFDNQVRAIRTIGVLNPDILMLELTAGGERERMDEWETAAEQNMVRAVGRELAARNMTVKTIAPGQHPDLPEVYYLNRAISRSLNWNTTYRTYPLLCGDSRVCRDYSLGPVEDIMDKQGVHALLIVYGINEIESQKRATARRRSRTASFWAGMAGVRFDPLRNPGTYLSMSLIDRSGHVLWYSGTATGKGYDLRDQAVVDSLAKLILSRLAIGE